MSGPQELRREREQEEAFAITQQLNEQRFDRAYELQTPQEIEAAHRHHEQQLLSHRRELYELGLAKDMNLVVAQQQQAPQTMPPVSKLSDRKRRKIADKRANNLKKAQKANLTGATEDTLPMLDAVKKFSKEYTKNPPAGDELYSYQLNPRLFSPDFPEEQECSIDVAQGLRTLAKLQLSVRQYPDDVHRHTQIADIAMRANARLIAPLEYALRIVMAANGVDMKTGTPITNPAVIEQARILRVAAIRSYEKAVAEIPQMLQEEAENYFAGDLERAEREIEQNDREHRAFETEDLDFTYHYQPLEDEFVRLRGSIDAHPAEYAAHQAVIDQCYQRYLDANRQIAKYGRRILALNQQALSRSTAGKVRSLLQERANRLQASPELENLQTLAAQQRETIRFLVEGRPFPPEMAYMYKVLEDEYGIHTEARAQEQREQALIRDMSPETQATFNRLSIPQRQIAVRMLLQMQEKKKRIDNFMARHSEASEDSQKDLRVMRLFSHGMLLDEHGAPLNAQEAAYQAADDAFAQAYLSDDLTVTGPMLAPFIQEQLDFPYQNFDPEQEFLNDPAGFFMLLNRNVYLQNLMCDHPEYFDTLPEETMQKLDKIRTIGAFLSCYVNAQAATYGINANLAKWLEEPGMVDANIAHLEMMRIQAKEVLK